MVITDLYSKRQKRLPGEAPDVYQHDDIPPQLRAQIVHIMDDTMAKLDLYTGFPVVRRTYDTVATTLCHEYGHLDWDAFLPPAHPPHHRLVRFFMDRAQTEEILDIIERCFAEMASVPLASRAAMRPRELVSSLSDRAQAEWFSADRFAEAAEDAVAEGRKELNHRFLDHGVGFHLESGKIIRIDSQVTHNEIVMPCFAILSGKEYANAKREFLSGHEYYRKGNLKGALMEWQKSFESVMKIICAKREWEYPDGAAAKDLIRICIEHELIPPFWQSQFTSLRQLLLGVGVARNKLAGHGEGPERVETPPHVVAFALHMTAAAIVFLAEAEASGAGK